MFFKLVRNSQTGTLRSIQISRDNCPPGMVSYHTSQWGLNPQTFWSHTLHTVQMSNSSCDLLIEKYITAFELQESHAFFTFDRAPLMGGEALVELLIYTIQLISDSVFPWLNWLQYEQNRNASVETSGLSLPPKHLKLWRSLCPRPWETSCWRSGTARSYKWGSSLSTENPGH